MLTGEILKAIIEANLVDCMVALLSQLWLGNNQCFLCN